MPHVCHAFQNDIFEWHFVIRGPKDSEFEVSDAAPGHVNILELSNSG